ncbi:MAG TPA: DUF3971 domain-containing protein, partial [Gammaproteobacteria bacterium]|nr:DUF3971 domain-containing protein [Gammaproteobacteria bacterium]
LFGRLKLNAVPKVEGQAAFSLWLHYHHGKIEKGFLDLDGKDLIWGSGQDIPRLDKLKGQFLFRVEDNWVKLWGVADDLNFIYPKLFNEKINFNKLKAYAKWQLGNDLDLIQVPIFQAMIGDSKLNAEATVSLNPQKKLSLEGEALIGLENMSLERGMHYLPQKLLNNKLNEWLSKALIGGKIQKGTLVFRGPLSLLSFKKNQGVLQMRSVLENVNLDYMPQWPALTQMKANVTLRNEKLMIVAPHTKIAKGRAENIQAKIPDVFSENARVQIEGRVFDDLSDGLAVIANSPLKDTVGKNLDLLQAAGAFDLSLGLDIPLTSLARNQNPEHVKGALHMKDGSVKIPTWDFNIEALTGNLNFSESFIAAKELTGNLFQSPAHFEIQTTVVENVSYLRLLAKGALDISELLKVLPLPLDLEAKGLAHYHAELLFPENLSKKSMIILKIGSDLAGVRLFAPPPLNKRQREVKPLQMTLTFDPNHHVQVAGQFGTEMGFNFRLAQGVSTWTLLGGVIQVGQGAVIPLGASDNLTIKGKIKQFDFDVWKAYLGSKQNDLIALSNDEAFSKQPKLDLEIGDLNLLGVKFEKVHVLAKPSESKIWNIHFEGEDIQGDMVIPSTKTADITLNFEKLNLQAGEFERSLLSDSDQAWRDHPLDLKVRALRYKDFNFTDVEAHLVPTGKGYDIERLSARVPSGELSSKGSIAMGAENQAVTLFGVLKTENIGKSLIAWHHKTAIQEAKGEMEFDIKMPLSAGNTNFLSLEGVMQVHLRSGYVKGIDPGIGRLLNLLNIDSIQRRLRLDFKDVSKDGFSFDDLTGQIIFKKGAVFVNSLEIKGPSANVEFSGKAELQGKKLNAKMVVMPNMTGTLPLAAAVAAGNPVVGAAVWAAERLIGPKIQKMTRYSYDISGTWEDLQINEIT